MMATLVMCLGRNQEEFDEKQQKVKAGGSCLRFTVNI